MGKYIRDYQIDYDAKESDDFREKKKIKKFREKINKKPYKKK